MVFVVITPPWGHLWDTISLDIGDIVTVCAENPECQGGVTHDTAPSDEVLVITQPPSGVSRSLQYAK